MADITVKCECGADLDIYKVEATGGCTDILIKAEPCDQCWDAAHEEGRKEAEDD